MNEDDSSLAQGQMILGALAMGVATFLVVAYFVPISGEGGDRLFAPMMGTLGMMVPACAVAAVMIHKRMLAAYSERLRGGEEPDAEYPAAMRSADLVRAAMTEGPSLFGVVIFMLTRHPLALAVPVLGILLLVAQIPSRSRVQNRLTELRRPNY